MRVAGRCEIEPTGPTVTTSQQHTQGRPRGKSVVARPPAARRAGLAGDAEGGGLDHSARAVSEAGLFEVTNLPSIHTFQVCTARFPPPPEPGPEQRADPAVRSRSTRLSCFCGQPSKAVAAGDYGKKVPPGTPVQVAAWLPKVGPWTTLGPLTSEPVFGPPGRLLEQAASP